MRNCDGETNPSFGPVGLPATLSRCPWSQLSERAEAAPLVEHFLEWKAYGILPFGPTLADQPQAFAEAMLELDSELHRIREENKPKEPA